MKRTFLAVECGAIFVAAPLWIYWQREEFSRLIIPVLLGGALFGLAVLLFDPKFDRSKLWNAKACQGQLGHFLIRFLVLSIPLTIWAYFFERERFFQFPFEAPRIWITVMLLYPLLSVYPQEIIFRTLFFHRYRRLFTTPAVMILASGIAFGWAHLFFGHWIAVSLSAAGGILFASTYWRSKSTLAAVLEHGLWGDFLFTVGLGWYFYGGSIRAAAGG